MRSACTKPDLCGGGLGGGGGLAISQWSVRTLQILKDPRIDPLCLRSCVPLTIAKQGSDIQAAAVPGAMSKLSFVPGKKD